MSDESSSKSLRNDDSSEQQVDRTALVERARSFLLSPGVRHGDEAAKRKFLVEKGLTREEIDSLIRDLPTQAPPIPPRTYPPPPPSNLPALFVSLFKAMTWIAGTSSILLLAYYIFLLPRLTRSLAARHKLKLHQFELLGGLRSRIDELKTSKMQTFDSLTIPDELPPNVKTLADLPVNSAGEPTHPLAVVIRCAFLDDITQKFTLEDLYQRLLKHFPGLKVADESEYKQFMIRELTLSKSFEATIEDGTEYWALRRDTDSSRPDSRPTRPTSSVEALERLRGAITSGHRKSSTYQHTFKSLTDLTAYLSQESFSRYSANTGFRYGLPGTQPLGPAEEDVRRDIRALKGLLLNRRTFAPSSHPTPPPPTTVVAA